VNVTAECLTTKKGDSSLIVEDLRDIILQKEGGGMDHFSWLKISILKLKKYLGGRKESREKIRLKKKTRKD